MWQQGATADTLVIRTARRPLGGAWSAVETISPPWSYRPHIEGDTAGDVSVSYTRDVTGGHRYIYAVDRPNSGPWGAQTPLAGPALTDNISDLVVAPNSGRASVFWQDGRLAAPLAARTRELGTAWSAGTTTQISGDTAGRLDLQERDRAAVDGMGLVTAVWIAGQQGPDGVPERDHRRLDGAGHAGADRPGRRDDAARERADRVQRVRPRDHDVDGGRQRQPLALAARRPAPPWSAPKPIDGVPADADRARPGGRRHRPRLVRLGARTRGSTSRRWRSRPTATRSAARSRPRRPARHRRRTRSRSAGRTRPGRRRVRGTREGARRPPGHADHRPRRRLRRHDAGGRDRADRHRRAGRARRAGSATKFRRVGVVRVPLKQGRNVVRVKRVKRRKLARGSYRATITPKVGTQSLAPVRVTFKIRRSDPIWFSYDAS